MSHTDTAVRTAGMWLALASIIMVLVFVFHGPISPSFDIQMSRIADGSVRWAVVHWAAAGALSFFAIASLIALTAGSRLTQEWWTLSAWALLPIGALWTMGTAVAEATVIFDAAVKGDQTVYQSWWRYAEGRANGFAAMALAFATIAANEARTPHSITPAWASWIGAVAGTASFIAWASGSWLGLAFAAPIWVAASIVVSLWLAWFGLSLARREAGEALVRQDAPSRA